MGSNQHLRLAEPPARRNRRADHTQPQQWRPYLPKLQGPYRKFAPAGSSAHCQHCGGPTEKAIRTTFATHIEYEKVTWICRRGDCLGRRDPVIITSPLGQYERRC